MKKIFTYLMILFAIASCWQSAAQPFVCQLPAVSCKPASYSDARASIFSSGLFSIQLNTTTYSSSGAVGSQNRYVSSCDSAISLIKGLPVPISITNGTLIPENVRVWIDYNRDGIFDPVTEIAFSSDNLKIHNGFITLPASAPTDTALIMRVSSDGNIGAPIPTPCSRPQVGQVWDLVVIGRNNVSPPDARFTVSDTLTCSGLVQFTDQSINSPSQWIWDFGDTTNSFDQNPLKRYTRPGIYTVKLKVINANGIDSLVRTNLVTYNDTVPVAAACTPVVTNACCGYGISKFTWADARASLNPVNGYIDRVCDQRVHLINGQFSDFSLITSTSNSQDTRIWVDVNNDGAFTANELAYEGLVKSSPLEDSITVTLTDTLLYGKPLRARISTDIANSIFGPCSNLTSGAILDVTVVVKENRAAPSAQFTQDGTTGCTQTFTFRNQTQNGFSKFKWYFGDGSTDTVNASVVTHTYANVGSYSVSLVVINKFGRDSLTKFNFVVASNGPVAACANPTSQSSVNSGILRFRLNTIDVTSSNSSEGYKDFTCTTSTSLLIGNSYNALLELDQRFIQNLLAYIDLNQDGRFDQSELIFSSQTARGSVIIPFVAPGGNTNVPLRLRVIANTRQLNIPPPSPCNGIDNGQAEDYTIVLNSLQQPPIASFTNTLAQICVNGSVAFTNTSTNQPSSVKWNFGDGTPISSGSPISHTYTSAGTYTVKLIVANSFGADSVIANNLVTVLTLPNKTDPACRPTPTNYQGLSGIDSAVFNNGAVTFSRTVDNRSAYYDLSCAKVLTVDPEDSISFVLRMPQQGNQVIKIYLDADNDRNFAVNELVYNRLRTNGVVDQTGFFIVPLSALANTALRLRIMTETNSNNFQACGPINNGNVTDITVIVRGVVTPPVAAFSFSGLTDCEGIVSFSDQSSGVPDSYVWDFGDGSPVSTIRFPSHTYTAAGTYNVKLKVTNPQGADSLTRPLTLNTVSGVKNVSCVPVTAVPTNIAPTTNLGIRRVRFGRINRFSGNWREGYQNFACTDTNTVQLGAIPDTLFVHCGNATVQIAGVFIDLNNDGVLAQSERVILQGATPRQDSIIRIFLPFGNPSYPVVVNKLLRMRIIVNPANSPNFTACSQLTLGQGEDYGIRVLEPNAIKSSLSANNIKVYPNPALDKLTIEIESPGSNNIQIVDNLGRTVRSMSSTKLSTEINVADLPKGYYSVVVGNTSNRIARPFIKN